MKTRTRQQLRMAIERLEEMQHVISLSAEMPLPGQSLAAVLAASAEMEAIDVALESLRAQLDGMRLRTAVAVS